MVNAYDSTFIFSHVGIILLLIYDSDPHILFPLEHRNNTEQASPTVKGTGKCHQAALDLDIQHELLS